MRLRSNRIVGWSRTTWKHSPLQKVIMTSRQIRLLNEKLETLEHRYDAARRDGQIGVMYWLRTRISVVTGVICMYEKYKEKILEEVVESTDWSYVDALEDAMIIHEDPNRDTDDLYESSDDDDDDDEDDGDDDSDDSEYENYYNDVDDEVVFDMEVENTSSDTETMENNAIDNGYFVEYGRNNVDG